MGIIGRCVCAILTPFAVLECVVHDGIRVPVGLRGPHSVFVVEQVTPQLVLFSA